MRQGAARAGAAALAALICTRSATSLAALEVELGADTQRTEVGRAVHVELSAMSDSGEAPSSPRLRVPPGLVAQGPSISSQQRISMGSGGFHRSQGLTATWLVMASRAGRYVIGPATVVVDGRPVTSRAITLDVLEAGSLPAPQRAPHWPGSRGFDPFDDDLFDPFSLLPQPPGLEPEPLPPSGSYPGELSVGGAPDPVAFVRAELSPPSAVVGEQVTARIFAYGSRGPFREDIGTTEPRRDHFLSYPLDEPNAQTTVHRLPIGGELWHATRLRRIALFPLEAGRLELGPMKVSFAGRGYAAARGQGSISRASPPVFVTVTEPPLAGRPPGYQIGDVGDFSLEAEVSPRKVAVGEAVSVILKVTGTGNLPGSLRVPQQAGVEWLEPAVRESIGPKGDVIGGWRSFGYVVRFERPGPRELGAVELPYFDPSSRRYEVARAELGRVDVEPRALAPSAPSSSAAAPEVDAQGATGRRLVELLPARHRLDQPPAPSWRLTDRPVFWLGLFVGPGLVLVLGAGSSVVRGMRERLSARRAAPERRVQATLADARRALARKDSAALASAIERALYVAIESASALKARGVLRAELTEQLTRRGVAGPAAAELVALLDQLEALRFAGGGTSERLEALLGRAEAVAQQLTRGARSALPRDKAP